MSRTVKQGPPCVAQQYTVLAKVVIFPQVGSMPVFWLVSRRRRSRLRSSGLHWQPRTTLVHLQLHPECCCISCERLFEPVENVKRNISGLSGFSKRMTLLPSRSRYGRSWQVYVIRSSSRELLAFLCRVAVAMTNSPSLQGMLIIDSHTPITPSALLRHLSATLERRLEGSLTKVERHRICCTDDQCRHTSTSFP